MIRVVAPYTVHCDLDRTGQAKDSAFHRLEAKRGRRMARQSDIDLVINTIRMLAVDAVQKANSGHPSIPMDAAPTAYVLWQRALRYDPADPHWLNRDRFVLSSGHASMLLYSLIHLTGIKAANPSYERLDRDAITLEDIKNFRLRPLPAIGHSTLI
jgi:transketolase